MRRRERVPAVVLVALVSTAVGGVVTAVAPAAGADTVVASAPSRYVPTDPTRLVDTREGSGTPVGEAGTLVVDLADDVPADATAVVVNLTADAPTQPGYLTVSPADTARPSTSSLNKRAGETRSNAVTVALPSTGSRQLAVYNQAGTTQVIVDLVGWYVPRDAATSGPTPAAYYPYEAPFRVLDSRSGSRFGPTGGAAIVLPAPPRAAGVSAVAVTVTAVDPTGPGYLTAWAGGDRPRPTVSTVNYGYDAATPNSAVVPAYQDDDGIHFTVANAVGVTDVLVDVVGLYALPGGDAATSYVPVAPTRLADTRVTGSTLGPGGTVGTTVPTADGDSARVANVNVTAVGATVASFLAVYPDGAARPGTSTLNPGAGQVVANGAQTRLGADGAFRVFNNVGAVDVVADLQGYFIADSPDRGGDDAVLPWPDPVRGAAG